MEPKEILKFCLEQGLLVDKDVLGLFSESSDTDSVKLIIERIKNQTQQKIITKELFIKNSEKVQQVFSSLPKEHQKNLNLQSLKVKLGLSIEISKEVVSSKPLEQAEKEFLILNDEPKVKVVSVSPTQTAKIGVEEFVKHFRNRYTDLKNIIQERPELKNLTSINKIYGERQGVSIIGMVADKRVTKNKNLILEVEDLTGRIKVLINYNKKELYEKAEEICMDSVIGFSGSGNNEILFANSIVFPDTVLAEKKNSPVEEYAVFISDLQYGSKRFFIRSFEKFIDYLNGKVPNTPESLKIKYLIIGGDLITGVGNYPGQEKDLEIVDLEEQNIKIAGLLKQIRKDIKIIIGPGNHEGVRLMEPQPIFDEKYAWPLYEMDNVILIENPCVVNIGAKRNFSGFNILYYHGFSYRYYANNVSRLLKSKAMNSPEEIIKYLLRNRHLAPTHNSVQSFPHDKDVHLIRTAPDIVFSGHIHKSAVSYYNNILIICGSSWEGKTPYQEKFGNTQDFCKVPLLNLKTRAIKILDFE
ncbi:MAG: metallophosphoesterase [Candidatus Pacearchaeota archaeon]